MFLRKCLGVRTNYCKRILLPDQVCLSYKLQLQRTNNLSSKFHNGFILGIKEKESPLIQQHFTYSVWQHRRYSKRLADDEPSKYEKEIIKIKEIFPQPRVTLNELATKVPQKTFDIHYKQMTIAPKGTKKKAVLNNDWSCIYSFVWPEKMKFECTAISKRQAAEKAATQAIHWLYSLQRIDKQGNPVYKQDVLNELRKTIDTPISATISEGSVQLIENIWQYYDSDIKNIYKTTAEEASKIAVLVPGVLKKDSTVDEEDPEDLIPLRDNGDLSEVKTQTHPVFGNAYKRPSEETLSRRDRVLKRKFERYDEALTALPIDLYADEIASTISANRVSVIVGAAGCGKSTRAPAAILRHCGAGTAAIVSEPRRVAAIGLAQRVADELGEQVGDSIGYQVRLHSKLPKVPGGGILYCTSGVLLRRLQSDPGLKGCTHVFIDEAHERDVNTDITLLLLKRALDLNPELRVAVMSATLDIAVFTEYFKDCPVIEVPGRTFPVDILYLDDINKKYNINLPVTMANCNKEDGRPQVNCPEVVEVIKAVDKSEKEGAILVFLPGWAEIKQTKTLLDDHYKDNNFHLILPVHSRLSTTDQTKMFSKPLPGVRKIVLATNIAETSITIPDVVYVVDTGAHKENRVREGTGTASLETVWVSQAGAQQRTGRAGRVQPGICYRMYTQEKESEFAPHTTPEILRIPLEQTVLDCKTYAPDDKVEDFLSQLPEPPSKKVIDFAVKDLIDLGALTPSEKLTRLGSILASLSIHPRLGSSMLTAATVGNVVAAHNVAAHCATNIQIFADAADRATEIREMKRTFSPHSDYAALHWIQSEFEQSVAAAGRRGVDEWCGKYGLKRERLAYVKSMSNLLLEQLFHSGFIEADPDVEELNMFSDIEANICRSTGLFILLLAAARNFVRVDFAMSNLLLEQLFNSGFIEADPDVEELNMFSDIDELTSAVLLAGSNSLLVTKKQVKTKGKLATVVELLTSKGERAHISSESVNYGIKKKPKSNQLLTYFGGYHSLERRALLVHKSSIVAPHAALLFCKGGINVEGSDADENTALYLPKHYLRIQMPSKQADVIVKAREMLWSTLQYYIDRDVKNMDPSQQTTVSKFKVRLVKAIGRMLVEAEKDLVSDKSENIVK